MNRNFYFLKVAFSIASILWIGFLPSAGSLAAGLPLQNANSVLDKHPKTPQAYDDYDITTVNSPVTTDVLANDKNLQDIPITVTVIQQPSHGTAHVNDDNTVTYTPAHNYIGDDIYRYQVCNAYQLCSSANVHITVENNNRPPVAVNDTANTTPNTPVLINVLANDSDPDGDTLSIQSVSSPAHGTAVISMNQVLYTPSPNFTGKDTFSYVISDGHGGTATGQVTVNVAAPSTAPVAVSDVYTVTQGTTLNIAAPGVLANDSVKPGGTLTAILTTPPANGTLQLNSDGSFTYTPNGNFAGQDTFGYKASDGSHTSHETTDTIIVQDVTNPTVSWMAPATNQGVASTGSGDITLQTSASDNTAVDHVRYLFWNAKTNQFADLGDVPAPYQLQVNSMTFNPGWNQVFAVAYDTSGNASVRQYIWIYLTPSGDAVFLPIIRVP